MNNPTVIKMIYVGTIVIAILILVTYMPSCRNQKRVQYSRNEPRYNIKVIDDNDQYYDRNMIEGFDQVNPQTNVAQPQMTINNPTTQFDPITGAPNPNYLLPCDCSNQRANFPQQPVNVNTPTNINSMAPPSNATTTPPSVNSMVVGPLATATAGIGNWFDSFWKQPEQQLRSQQPFRSQMPLRPELTQQPQMQPEQQLRSQQPFRSQMPLRPELTQQQIPMPQQMPQPVQPQIPTQPQTPSPPAQPTQPVDQSLGNIWVSEHNRIRANVGANISPVVWNPQIAQEAQNYSAGCKFEHSSQASRTKNGIVYGENLAYGSPFGSYSDDKIVKMWEDEKKDYTYPNFPDGNTGHYTQIINKNVSEIGCGCTNCNNSKICVCRYNKGQMGGQSPY